MFITKENSKHKLKKELLNKDEKLQRIEEYIESIINTDDIIELSCLSVAEILLNIKEILKN